MIKHISVLLSTRNRCGALRITLEAMARLRQPKGASAQFVIVDNGSEDDTARVLREASRSLPIQTYYEPAPGKSIALNTGLDRATLGDLVVFTDDDVTPDETWLDAIIDVTQRWPRHSVFGGRIEPTWPNGVEPPRWARDEFIQSFAFTRHAIANAECEYPNGGTPFGPNYWVRRPAMQGMRFMRGLGPQPRGRKLGQETEFLIRLLRKGLVPVYSPNVCVQHRIEAGRISKLAVYRRAFQLGAGLVYTRGVPEQASLERSRALWRLQRARSLAGSLFRISVAAAWPNVERRVLMTVGALMNAGEQLEALQTQRSSRAHRGPNAAGVPH